MRRGTYDAGGFDRDLPGGGRREVYGIGHIGDLFARFASNFLGGPETPEPDIRIEKILHAFFLDFFLGAAVGCGSCFLGKLTSGISA